MQNLAIFGAGNIGKQTKKLVEEKYSHEYKLICFVDNDPAKQGTSIEDTPVISAEKLLELHGGSIDCVAIALSNCHVIAAFLFQQKIIPIHITLAGIYPLADDINNEKRFCHVCQRTSFYFDIYGLIPRQNDHVRAYGRDYADRLRDAGFSITITYAEDLLNESDMERLGLNNGASGEIYFCTKINSASKNPRLFSIHNACKFLLFPFHIFLTILL